MREDDLRLGVDLGGTKTEAVVLRLRDGRPEVLSRLRVATEREHGYDHILRVVAGVIAEVTRAAGLSAPPPIGVGMPGSVTRAGRIKNSNTTCLNGRPFRDDLMRLLGRPVAFANDANCFALAEAVFGAGRGRRLVFGVILGTGVGGGVVIDGRIDQSHLRRPLPPHPVIWDGLQGIAGEWGHVVLDPQGPACYCGRSGCIERYLSGPAIEEAYAARTGARRPLQAIAAAAADPVRDELFAAVAAHFGRALATVINVLDPEVVVLGGGVSNLELFYGAGVAQVARWIFSDALLTPIVKHELGDSAGVFGAALLPGGGPP